MPKLSTRSALETLGARIAELRRARGFTQESFAEKMGWTRQYEWALEAGRQNLSVDSLVTIANALGTDLPGLFSPPTDRTPRKPGRPPSEGKGRGR